MKEQVIHTLEPIFDRRSRVLLLGTIPSPKSRETGFYYGNPHNRFWNVLAAVYREPVPQSIAEKRMFLLRHKIALWDVLSSCEIQGASDGSITAPAANNLSLILSRADIRAVFCTGTKAAQLYQKHCQSLTGIAAIGLPSTSPANCRMTVQDLAKAYKMIRQYTDDT